VVSGLDQLPAFPPFLSKEIFQPFNASMKDIVDKTEAILIAFDSTFLFFGFPIGQFVNRNPIFPLGHRFFLFLDCSGLFTLNESFFKGYFEFQMTNLK
jgi:hypothetical protein